MGLWSLSFFSFPSSATGIANLLLLQYLNYIFTIYIKYILYIQIHITLYVENVF